MWSAVAKGGWVPELLAKNAKGAKNGAKAGKEGDPQRGSGIGKHRTPPLSKLLLSVPCKGGRTRSEIEGVPFAQGPKQGAKQVPPP